MSDSESAKVSAKRSKYSAPDTISPDTSMPPICSVTPMLLSWPPLFTRFTRNCRKTSAGGAEAAAGWDGEEVGSRLMAAGPECAGSHKILELRPARIGAISG
ncbi:hypothetical protein WJ972_19065 [Achromobacter insuavis]